MEEIKTNNPEPIIENEAPNVTDFNPDNQVTPGTEAEESEEKLTAESDSKVIINRKFCTNCGEALKPGQKFCGNCGMKFDNPSVPPSASAPAAAVAIDTKTIKSKKPPLIIGAAAVVLIIAIIALLGNTGKSFKGKYTEYEGQDWFIVAEDGSYMEVDTNPMDLDDTFVTEAFDAIKAINKDLGFSSSVENKMLHTSSMDGRQTEESKNATVSWTYHPNRGLEVIYEVKE